MSTQTKAKPTAYTDPTGLPALRPYSGAPNAAHRWRASDVAGVDGDVITTLPALAGGIDLTQATSGLRPLLKIESGVKMLRFDGTDDMMVPASAFTAANIRTITVVARVRAAAGSVQGLFYTGVGYVLRTNASPTAVTQVNGGGSGATNVNLAVDPTSTSVFHVITLACGTDLDGNAVRALQEDGTSVAVTGDGQPSSFRLGVGYLGGGAYGNVDYLAALAWPYALSAPQRDAVRTQIKAIYPTGLVA